MRARGRLDGGFEFFDELGVGGQVGNALRNGFQRGLEDQRKAQQWAMEVATREMVEVGDDLRNLTHRGGQRRDVGGARKDDPAAAPGEQRNVSQKLERVAGALLGMEEQSLAGQWLA